ncbi:hypothetical protein [Sorangium atrum]|uniref:Uncharacterized protein n=1 Tax=Sorangium atrum TaxID=2995308 RepID=A0ABT5CAQ0_9BACT|nr:hypothetical protein [Sorangium aterium]MDC0683524.1 hypothetical protein [Sorangium aterium]
MNESISGQAASGSNGSDRAKLSIPQEGLIYTWVDGSLGVVEEIVRAGFGFLEDVRVETQERLGATLDLIEGVDRSVFRVARKALVRMDGISERALSSSQIGWLALLGTIRRTSQGAAGFASETVVAVVGERRATQQLIIQQSS